MNETDTHTCRRKKKKKRARLFDFIALIAAGFFFKASETRCTLTGVIG